MKSIDQFPIYELRDALRRSGENSFDQLFAVMAARRHLESLLQGQQLEIAFSKSAAETVLAHIGALTNRYFEDENGNMQAPDETLPQWVFAELLSSVDVFEHQLNAELKQMATYLVPNQGIYDTSRLVDRADLHLHSATKRMIPKFAVDEFKRAGKCLAFGLNSASGFHSARAVESQTKSYFLHFLRKPNKETLGQMASQLAALRSEKSKPSICPNENTVRHLQDFASFDRNPLMHQNIDLSEIDARTLFSNAASVIQEMARELTDLIPNTAQSSSNVTKIG